MTNYVGLDVSSKDAAFAITTDGGSFEFGKLLLKDLGTFLQEHQIHQIGIDYTGRLAERWAITAEEYGVATFFVHSVERRAMSRMAGQTIKTDPEDARRIAKMLYLRSDAGRRKQLGMLSHLFTDAAKVRAAWDLRSMIASMMSWSMSGLRQSSE